MNDPSRIPHQQPLLHPRREHGASQDLLPWLRRQPLLRAAGEAGELEQVLAAAVLQRTRRIGEEEAAWSVNVQSEAWP